MPSPIGHAFAGVIVAWASERLPASLRPPTRVTTPVVAACVLAALAPDLDLLYQPVHRMATHSLVAAALAMIVAAAVTRQVTGRVDWQLAWVVGAAYGSHILFDWLGEDLYAPRGVQLFWPFSDVWFISDWNLFRRTQRADPFSLLTMQHNLRTAVQEVLTLGPVLVLLWLTRRRPTGN